MKQDKNKDKQKDKNKKPQVVQKVVDNTDPDNPHGPPTQKD